MAVGECPANRSGVSCGGLKHDPKGDASAALCAAACCDDSACKEWGWKSASVAGGGCWRGVCGTTPNSNAGWVGGTTGAAAVVWSLTAKATGGDVILASGFDVTCEPGVWLNMSLAVQHQSVGPPVVIASAGGKELVRAVAPAWGLTSGAASVGCSIGIAEFDDIEIESL